MTDKELTERIFSDLETLPAQIRDLELDLLDLRTNLGVSRINLEDAELDTKINAVIDGKNETVRKQQVEIAIASSPTVKEARNKVFATENELAAKEIEVKTLAKRWQGAMAMAELQAARINLMAKYQSPKK